MIRLEELIDKFKIPNKEKLEPLFNLEVEDNLLNGSLTIRKDGKYYDITSGKDACVFVFIDDNPCVDLLIRTDEDCCGNTYCTDGSYGFVN